jgi:hypothetical protein
MPYKDHEHHSRATKSLVTQLTPLSVSNRDIQDSNPPSPAQKKKIIQLILNEVSHSSLITEVHRKEQR